MAKYLLENDFLRIFFSILLKKRFSNKLLITSFYRTILFRSLNKKKSKIDGKWAIIRRTIEINLFNDWINGAHTKRIKTNLIKQQILSNNKTYQTTKLIKLQNLSNKTYQKKLIKSKLIKTKLIKTKLIKTKLKMTKLI